jgi:hypothetical protein
VRSAGYSRAEQRGKVALLADTHDRRSR